MKKKVLIAIGVIIGLLVIGFVAYPAVMANVNKGQGQSLYQTEPAKLGDLTAYVGATGSVRANQTAHLVWETSGKVANVRVKKGDLVTAKAVLSDLEKTSLSQAIIQAQSELVSAQRDLEKVNDNSEARASAQLALIQAQKDLDSAQKESQSKLYQRASKDTIDIARANLINANEALDSAEAIYNANTGRGDDDPVYAAALSQLARARQDQTRAEYNLRYTQELPDPLDVQEVYVKLDQAKVKLLTAKQEWERIKDGPDPVDIIAAQARVDSALATVSMARIEAPFDGTITDVSIQPGDLVSAGTAAFQIDDLSQMRVDVQVSEVDINRIQIGQPAALSFDAIPGNEYDGTVTDIASVGTSASGAVNFTVTVTLGAYEQEVKPGMTAAVNVAVNELKNVLLIPNRAVRTVNNQRVVYVLRNNLPVPVEIKLGSSSNAYSQLTKGEITAGEQIILNPPATMTGPGMMGGGF